MRPKFMLPWLALCCLVLNADGQPASNLVRSVSLRDCIEMCLQNRLNVLIRGLTPEMAALRVKAAQGIYDPTLSFQASRNFVDQPGQFDPKKTNNDNPYELKADGGGPGLSGYTPWGLSYSLSASANYLTGHRLIVGADPFPTEWYSTAGITLKQPLLKNFLVDSQRLRIQLAKKDLQISEFMVRAMIMEDVAAVATAYYELMYARERLNVTRKGLEVANQLLSQVHTKVNVGEATKLDEVRLQSSADTAQADVYISDGELQGAINRLKTLVSDDFQGMRMTAFEPTENLMAFEEILDVQTSWASAMTNRADLAEKRLAVQKLGLEVRFTSNQRLPGVDAFGTYGWQSVQPGFSTSLDTISRGTQPYYSMGVVVSYPLLNITARNNYKLAKKEMEFAELKLKRDVQDIIAAIDTAIETAKYTYRRTQATRSARVAAEAALTGALTEVQIGTKTTTDFLLLQSQVTQARTAEIRAMADYQTSLSRVALSDGTILNRHHVEIKVK